MTSNANGRFITVRLSTAVLLQLVMFVASMMGERLLIHDSNPAQSLRERLVRIETTLDRLEREVLLIRQRLERTP